MDRYGNLRRDDVVCSSAFNCRQVVIAFFSSLKPLLVLKQTGTGSPPPAPSGSNVLVARDPGVSSTTPSLINELHHGSSGGIMTHTHNDQSVMQIILTHVCCVTPASPGTPRRIVSAVGQGFRPGREGRGRRLRKRACAPPPPFWGSGLFPPLAALPAAEFRGGRHFSHSHAEFVFL